MFETLIPETYSVILGLCVGFALGTFYITMLARKMMLKRFGVDLFNKEKKNH